jgi:hypothetical protein
MELTTYPHLVPKLRMSGGLPLLPASDFIACIRTTLQLPLPFTPHIKITTITAPELQHKTSMGQEVPKECGYKVECKEFDNLYCTRNIYRRLNGQDMQHTWGK